MHLPRKKGSTRVRGIFTFSLRATIRDIMRSGPQAYCGDLSGSFKGSTRGVI